MGHRHGFNTPQLFETNRDQPWNYVYPEGPLVHPASSTVLANNSPHPGNNLQADGAQCVSHWNPSARGTEISSSRQIVHAPHNQSDTLSRVDPFHPSFPAATFQFPENHTNHAPPSNYAVDNSVFDLGTNMRGQHKRKSPMIPSIGESGSTSHYYCAGSSSNAAYARQNADVQRNWWEPVAVLPRYILPVEGESSTRNVRSRSSFDLNCEHYRPSSMTNPAHHQGSSRHATDPHNPVVDHSTWCPTLPALGMSHVHISNASHGRATNADSSSFNQHVNPFIIGSGTPNIPNQIVGYSHNPSSGRYPANLQRFNPTTAQTRSAYGGYPQGSNPANGIGVMGSFQLGQAAASEEGPRLAAAEGYPNRHPRAFAGGGWQNSDRSRSRSSGSRHRSSSVGTVGHDYMNPEGANAIGRSSFHGHRQHRELMLDVDNMSYEELLALGERIGSVSTGLTDDLQLKCLKETVYLSSEQVLMEERCVICLEEYENMDQIASLKNCNHEYHVGCIKKWLSMKNICPVCKAPALPDDNNKEKMKACI